VLGSIREDGSEARSRQVMYDGDETMDEDRRGRCARTFFNILLLEHSHYWRGCWRIRLEFTGVISYLVGAAGLNESQFAGGWGRAEKDYVDE